jgi:hypothetical protein
MFWNQSNYDSDFYKWGPTFDPEADFGEYKEQVYDQLIIIWIKNNTKEKSEHNPEDIKTIITETMLFLVQTKKKHFTELTLQGLLLKLEEII